MREVRRLSWAGTQRHPASCECAAVCGGPARTELGLSICDVRCLFLRLLGLPSSRRDTEQEVDKCPQQRSPPNIYSTASRFPHSTLLDPTSLLP